MTMKNAVFWGVSSQRASLASYCYIVPSIPSFVTLMVETICSSETSAVKEPRGLTSQKTKYFNFEDNLYEGGGRGYANNNS
jgi:hypothetical protein